MTSRRPAALTAVLATLAAALLGSLLLALPAQAEEKVVTITAEGVLPKVLEVAEGDVVRFVNEDASFGYRAVATSENWDLDSGPIGLLPGRSYTHPDPITEPGTYTYRVAEGEPYEGSVVLPSLTAPPPTGAPSPSPGPSRPPGTSVEPGPSGASPSPPATGGTGTGGAPPIAGGLDTPTSPAPAGVAPPPAIALPDTPGDTDAPLPQTAPEPEAEPTSAAAVPGRLGSPATARGYGLPAALAAVLAAGVASLLVRFLLAEPAAQRRARRAVPGSTAVATAD